MCQHRIQLYIHDVQQSSHIEHTHTHKERERVRGRAILFETRETCSFSTAALTRPGGAAGHDHGAGDSIGGTSFPCSYKWSELEPFQSRQTNSCPPFFEIHILSFWNRSSLGGGGVKVPTIPRSNRHSVSGRNSISASLFSVVIASRLARSVFGTP